MLKVIKGKVWKFGDDVNTDVMTPTRYLKEPLEELKKHVFEPIRPEFAKQVKPGDVIVGGASFGCGSSREHAPAAIKALGIAGIVAETFSRIFFRNSIAIGMPVLSCPGVSKIFKDGDILQLDVANFEVINLTTGKKLKARPLPPEMLEVLSKGGIEPLLMEIVRKG